MISGIGERVRAARKARGWTQQTLADRSGVSRVTIARLETDALAPSLLTLQQLAAVFRVSVGHLLGEPATGHGADAVAALRTLADSVRDPSLSSDTLWMGSVWAMVDGVLRRSP